MKVINFLKQHKIQGIIYILFIICAVKEIINGFNPLYVLISFGIMICCVYSTFNNRFFVKKYIECPNCNSKLNYKQRVCNICGFDFQSNNLSQNNTNIQVKKEVKKSNLLIFIGFNVILLPIAFVFMIWFIVALIILPFGGKITEISSLPTILDIAFHPLGISISIIGLIVLIIGIVKKIKEK